MCLVIDLMTDVINLMTIHMGALTTPEGPRTGRPAGPLRWHPLV